jgi:hypothetical protein
MKPRSHAGFLISISYLFCNPCAKLLHTHVRFCAWSSARCMPFPLKKSDLRGVGGRKPRVACRKSTPKGAEIGQFAAA